MLSNLKLWFRRLWARFFASPPTILTNHPFRLGWVNRRDWNRKTVITHHTTRISRKERQVVKRFGFRGGL